MDAKVQNIFSVYLSCFSNLSVTVALPNNFLIKIHMNHAVYFLMELLLSDIF